ncbi:hypothetical protein FPRO04_10402 [Fusarium proliferatum]|nr:hypothetical protein FPRO04_10402 [Fusarium proliferatum]
MKLKGYILRQLEVRLKSWNFSKYIDRKTWQHIDHKIRKRKEEGKDSDVIRDGKRLKKVKVMKETNRHRETNIFARFKTPPPSPTNMQLCICTPPALPMTFEWPSSLPWLRLRDAWNDTISVTVPKDMIIQQNSDSRHIVSSLMTILAAYGTDVESTSLSKLIAGISNVMPEWYPEEYVRTAQNLLTGPASHSSAEGFKVMVYMMSNSMATDWQFSFFLDLIGTGKIQLQAHFRNLRKESPTIQSFLENAFHFEIEKATSKNRKTDAPRLETLTSLLELGLDPDYPCYMRNQGYMALCTPIQQATRAGCLELIQLLLRFQARVDRTHVSDKRVAFVNLALDAPCSNSRKLRILAVLFEHGFLNKDEMVRATIELHDEEAILRVLDCGIDVTTHESSWLHPETRWRHPYTRSYIKSQSALMMAVQAGGRIANLMLDHLSLKGQPSPSALADAYIAAAYGGHHEIMLRLDAMHTSEVAYNKEGITPLQAVVIGGDPAVCKHILERQGGSTASLILVAAILGNLEVVQLLIEYGGDPNALFCTHDIQLYDYFNLGQYRGRNLTFLKLSDNHEFIHRHSGHPTPVLSMLMHSVPDFDLLEPSVLKLIENGATMPDGELATFSRLCVHTWLKAALDAGGNAKDVDKNGDTLLQCALSDDFIDEDDDGHLSKLEDQVLKRLLTVELLISAGAKLTGGEEGTAVGLAAWAGQLDILDKLLARFTEPSVLCSAILPAFITGDYLIGTEYWDNTGFWRAATDAPGYILGSPLALAALGEDTSGFREILRRGCKMDTVTWAIIAESADTSDYLQLLEEFRCGLGNATEYDKKLGTALCKAINEGQFDLVQYLVEVGADVNEYDIFESNCTSPLQCAMREGFIEVAVYLLEKKANINAPPAFFEGATALQFAAIGGHIGLARQLIELGARINARGSGKDGRSALEGAAEHGRLDMLALLVHHGAVTTGPGRQQLINSVAFAQQRAHITAAEWMKKNCGWSDADQHRLEFVNANAPYPVGKCIRSYCCDEYHDSDTQCVYHYTEEQRRQHYRSCWKCLELETEAAEANDIDGGNVGSSSSEDEDSDSERIED